jgi:hypothetical protein
MNKKQESTLTLMKNKRNERKRTKMIAQAKEISAAYRRGELKTKSATEFLQEINTEISDGLLEARE